MRHRTETDSEYSGYCLLGINTADMTELHPTSGHQSMTKPFPKTRWATETAERRSIERTGDSAPLLDKFDHRNWDMFVIWSFVVVSFAAFFFCLWAISAKCHGDWADLTTRNEGVTTKETNQIGRSK